LKPAPPRPPVLRPNPPVHMHAHPHLEAGEDGLPVTARLRWVLILTAGFLVVEFVGGLLSKSLALLSDAGHMLSDVAALTLALLAIIHMRRPPSTRHSYGFHRLETVSALANGILLCGVALVIIYEGVHRLRGHHEVRGTMMLVVAGAGLLVNLVGMALLRGDSKGSLGIRGAFLHIIGDTLGSVGAIAAAIVIQRTGWVRADAVVSIGIAVLIVASGVHLIRESLHILLEGVPRHIDLPEVENALRRLEGIVDLHDLHIWRIGSNFDTLTVHLVVNNVDEWRHRRDTARSLLHERFGIGHCTIEVEGPGEHVGVDCSESFRESAAREARRPDA
jgi:cobalt-zinc-cadmium efflux system protein